eukprot:Awhi_evm1s2320
MFVLPIACRINKIFGEILLAINYSTAIWLGPLVVEDAICKLTPNCEFKNIVWDMDIWPLTIVYFLLHLQRDFLLDIADVKGDTSYGLRSIANCSKVGTMLAYFAALFLVLSATIPASLIISCTWHPEWNYSSLGTILTGRKIGKHEEFINGKAESTRQDSTTSESTPIPIPTSTTLSSSTCFSRGFAGSGTISKAIKSSFRKERSRIRVLMKIQFFLTTVF